MFEELYDVAGVLKDMGERPEMEGPNGYVLHLLGSRIEKLAGEIEKRLDAAVVVLGEDGLGVTPGTDGLVGLKNETVEGVSERISN